VVQKILNEIFLTLIILILSAYSVIAVPAGHQNIKNIKFSHITNEDGLTHHETLFVMQDTQGFMWFGTKHGLNKYDGMGVVPYFHDPDSNNLNSLTGNFAHWIHEDAADNLWIATWGDGISKYDPRLDKFTNYQHEKNNPQSITSNNVWSLFVDSKRFVWAATDNGLSKLNPETKTFVHYRHDPKNKSSLSHNTVSRIKEDDQGIFWISTYGGGLNRFDPETETFIHYKHIQGNPTSLSNNNLWGVYIDSRKRIWIATEKGLNKFDPDTETFTSYQHDKTDQDSLSSNTVTFIHEDRSGMLWLGTFGGGLNRFDPEQETFVHYRNDTKDPYSLSNDIIMSIYEDTTGVIWVATYGGIDKYDPGEYQFEYYRSDLDNQKNLGNHKVRSIFQDNNGSVWIGSGGGLTQLSKTRGSDIHYLHDNSDPTSISGNDIWAIDQDKHGDLWIATHGAGLNRFIPAKKTFIRYEHDPGNPNTPACDPLYDLVVDEKREVLWIAAYLFGLDKFDIKTETFTHYPYDSNNPDGIVSNWVTTVFVDSKGFVWVGTESGLSFFDPETERFTNFKHIMIDPKSLSANMIQSVYEDSQNNVWIGTSDGLNRFDRDSHSFKRYSTKDGLAGNHVAGIIEDNTGHLWISTDKGLSKFNPQDGTFRNYEYHDGLQGNRFFMHSAHKNVSGELFFGGTNGFNVFNPNELKDNQHVPKIVFTDFQLFNQSVPVGENSVLTQHINNAQSILLDYDQHVFTIEFTALNYRNSKKNQYAYMMEGFDKNYTYTDSNKRSATYTNLNPGQYTFHVQGSNNDGVWNKKGASIEIIVDPPWWKTLWFKGTIIFIGIGLVFGMVRIKTHSVRQLNLRLEKQVAERTRELKTWLENSPVCTKILDLDFNLQFMSSAGIKGLKIQDVTSLYGMPYPFYFFPEPYKKTMIENLKKIIITGEVIIQEGAVSDIEGNKLWYHATLVPVVDDNGQIDYIIVVSADITDRILADEALQKAHADLENKVQQRTAELTKEITERIQTEKKLIESERKHRTLFETMVQGVVYQDADGKIISANPAAEKILGLTIDQMQGRVFTDPRWKAIHEDKSDFPGEKHPAMVSLRTGQPVNNVVMGIFHPDEEKCHWIRANSIPKIRPGDKNPYQVYTTFTDITEHKRLEAQLQQSQKMESIGTLAAGIAHDFNNILFPIVGHAEMLLEDIPNDSPFRESSNEILNSGLRAKELVKQILAFSRQEKGELKLMKMQPIIKEVLKLIRATIPTTIKINQDIRPDCGVIKADPTQIHQIVMNIAINAYHAMENTGGELTIKLKEVEIGESGLINPEMTPGLFACLTIADKGIGMDKELTNKIFDPFFTTKEQGKGTGMGLSVVHGIVTSMNGGIQIFSEPGKGTEFHIYFPLEKNYKKQGEKTNQLIQGGSEHVLLVDDEESIISMGRKMLERLGYQVTPYTNSVEALEAFGNNSEKFDLVISDLAMPNMAGEKLASEMLKIRPNIPIILNTGFSDKMTPEIAEKIGIKGIIMKPIVKSELAQTIRKVLDG